MKKKRKTYIKLFNIPNIALQAMTMLSEIPPRSYSEIAEKLGCDRSSVVHFHKKKIKEALTLENFNGVSVELFGGVKPQQIEVLNTGKDYKSYLKRYKKETVKLQRNNMKVAEKTIKKLKRCRGEDELFTDFDIW